MSDVGRPTIGELPTLEGRVMADLGHQVEALREENARLRASLELVRDYLSVQAYTAAAHTVDAVLKTP